MKKLQAKYKKGDCVKFKVNIATECSVGCGCGSYEEKEMEGIIKSWKSESTIKFLDVQVFAEETIDENGEKIITPYIQDTNVEEYGVPNSIFYKIESDNEVYEVNEIDIIDNKQ